jgi:hypothetical protein
MILITLKQLYTVLFFSIFVRSSNFNILTIKLTKWPKWHVTLKKKKIITLTN